MGDNLCRSNAGCRNAFESNQVLSYDKDSHRGCLTVDASVGLMKNGANDSTLIPSTHCLQTRPWTVRIRVLCTYVYEPTLGRTERTGHWACLITRSVVEPTSNDSTRLCPLIPKMIRSISLTSAYWISCSCGSPARSAV
jgi:hypothetical protein